MKAIDVITKVYLGVMFGMMAYAVVFIVYKLVTRDISPMYI
jgi:hypothetical protein